MTRLLALGLAVVLVGCTPADVTEGEDPPTDGTPVDTDTDTDVTVDDTDVPVPTADTGVPVVEFDCATIPLLPTGYREVPGGYGYHDVAFSPDGFMVGSDRANNSIVRVDSSGTTTPFVPNIGTIEQMAWLPDGDLAVASVTDGIVRVAPTGGTITLNPNIRPYGLILGPDEMLYAADQSKVHRVDPTTGAAEVLVPQGSLASGSPRVINFNLDYTQMYIGTYSGNGGKIYVIDLDANLDPSSPPRVLASGVGSGDYHDTLGIDICGYLYVADYNAKAMYRISPAGDVQLLLEATTFIAREYGHGMEWGTGEDGWLDDAIYVTQPYNGNTVTEVLIGVPSRHWTGGVAINLP